MSEKNVEGTEFVLKQTENHTGLSEGYKAFYTEVQGMVKVKPAGALWKPRTLSAQDPYLPSDTRGLALSTLMGRPYILDSVSQQRGVKRVRALS